MKYRKKPIVIEAVKFHYAEYQDNPLIFDELPMWLSEAINAGVIKPAFESEDYWILKIDTLEGVMSAFPGDFIIQGIEGEIYPCKPSIFEKTYEEED